MLIMDSAFDRVVFAEKSRVCRSSILIIWRFINRTKQLAGWVIHLAPRLQYVSHTLRYLLGIHDYYKNWLRSSCT